MGILKRLLDTHAFHWWCIDDPALSSTDRAATEDRQNEKFVSAITAWEFVTKFRSGKEQGFAGIAADVTSAVAAHGFTELPPSMRHMDVAANLPMHHKDPTDRSSSPRRSSRT